MFSNGDKIDSHFQKYISSYVIENSKNEEIQKQLDDIHEGLIIYTGITSELDYSKLGSWKNSLTLYLDQEILFHIVGYNGEFFKKQADDFLSLVSEINRKEKLIKLLYFDSVKRDIEHFFNNAEAIVSGKMISNGTIAMAFVTKDCFEPSDVITKKECFILNCRIGVLNVMRQSILTMKIIISIVFNQILNQCLLLLIFYGKVKTIGLFKI